MHLVGILQRLSIVDLKPISLNPEFDNLGNMIKCASNAKKRGAKLLNVFFHSSDIYPGTSPHVKNEKDLDNFLGRMDSFFEISKREWNIEGVTLCSFRKLVEMDQL